MALGATLFALMNFLARLATTSASWATAGAVRALVGALVAFGVARWRGRSLAPRRFSAIFWRSVLGTIAMLSTFYALSSKTVSLGNTVTLLNLSPVFLALLAPVFLGERTSARVALAIGIALAGVVLVVQPAVLFGGSHGSHLAAVVGSGPSAATTNFVAVFAALSTSIAMILLRRAGKTETAEAIAFHFSLLASGTMTFLALFDLRLPSLRDGVLMIGAGVCAGFGQLAITRAYALESAARVGGMSYLSVVVSAVLGAAVLGEHTSTITVLGMALVIGGGLVAMAPPSRPLRSA